MTTHTVPPTPDYSPDDVDAFDEWPRVLTADVHRAFPEPEVEGIVVPQGGDLAVQVQTATGLGLVRYVVYTTEDEDADDDPFIVCERLYESETGAGDIYWVADEDGLWTQDPGEAFTWIAEQVARDLP